MIGSSRSIISGVTLDCARSELAPVLRSGRQLGHQHVHVALDAHEEVVELAAPLRLRAGDAQHCLCLVDHAVRGGLIGVLAHAAAVEESGRAVVALPRVDLHRQREPRTPG